jgi:hypothetical protein
MKEEKKSGSARTQRATRNEEWSDQRLQSFLELEPPEGVPAEYNILLKAYRGMTEDLFERFLALYIEAGHDLNIALMNGSNFLDLVSRHRKSTGYVAILEAAGAVATHKD